MLSSIIRWKEQQVVVYAGLSAAEREADMHVVIGDMILLESLGIEIVFACNSKSQSCVEKVRRQGIVVHEIEKDDDLVELLEKLKAVKFFFLSKKDGIYLKGSLVHDITDKEAKKLLAKKGAITGGMRRKIELAVSLCKSGAKRIHFANVCRREAFLQEFLTGKGSGTMIYGGSSSYNVVRPAVKDDSPEIVRILQNSLNSTVVEEVIAKQIDRFMVFAVDGYPHATTMLQPKLDGNMEISYLALSGEFEASNVLSPLIKHAIGKTADLHKKELFIPVDRAPALIGIQPWFLNLGFKKEIRYRPNKTPTKVWVKQM